MMRISGERYIVQQSYKLKSASYKYWEFEKDKVPFLTSNIPESGEYWLLDIYDTKGGRIKQKTYDVFKMVREYNKEYIPRKIPEYKRYLYTEQGRVYLPINMVITRNSELKSEMGLIDIEAGKIVESTPSGKTAKYLYTREKNLKSDTNFEDILNQNDKLSKQSFGFVFSIFGFKDRIQKNQEIPLVSKYPKVYDILSKGSLSELYFLGKEDVRFKISFLKLVVPKSENIFKNLTIPESSSKDGQEHIVQNEEEFLEYYQGNLKEK